MPCEGYQAFLDQAHLAQLATPQALCQPLGFSLMPAYQCQKEKNRETGKGGEDREEFHFEVAEGRRQGAEGGRYVYVCVQENKGGVFPAA